MNGKRVPLKIKKLPSESVLILIITNGIKIIYKMFEGYLLVVFLNN